MKTPVDRVRSEDCSHREAVWGLTDRGFSYGCPHCGLRGTGKTPPEAHGDFEERGLDVLEEMMRKAPSAINQSQGHRQRGRLSA